MLPHSELFHYPVSDRIICIIWPAVSAVHRPFHISICISTLPTQHSAFILQIPDGLFSEKMRKCTEKPLLIILDTIFLYMLCERVISPQEPSQFSRTKW